MLANDDDDDERIIVDDDQDDAFVLFCVVTLRPLKVPVCDH